MRELKVVREFLDSGVGGSRASVLQSIQIQCLSSRSYLPALKRTEVLSKSVCLSSFTGLIRRKEVMRSKIRINMD